jgi:hypothetical protein
MFDGIVTIALDHQIGYRLSGPGIPCNHLRDYIKKNSLVGRALKKPFGHYQ